MPTSRRTVDAKGFSPYQSAAAAQMQRQSYYETKLEILRERAARSCNFAHIIARKEVKKPSVSSGSFGYFSSCWEK